MRGGVSLAGRLGVSPLLVGLTVVACASTPELVASTMAAAKSQGTIAIGNAVGSNIFNIGVILGLTALMFLLFCLDARIQFWEASRER